jgi:hypothetical protein
MTAAAARAQIIAALATLPDEDLLVLARLVALLPLASLRAELAGISDIENRGTTHQLVPTSRAQYARGLVLGALDALGSRYFGRGES